MTTTALYTGHPELLPPDAAKEQAQCKHTDAPVKMEDGTVGLKEELEE
jgi:hypothetical protein